MLRSPQTSEHMDLATILAINKTSRRAKYSSVLHGQIARALQLFLAPLRSLIHSCLRLYWSNTYRVWDVRVANIYLSQASFPYIQRLKFGVERVWVVMFSVLTVFRRVHSISCHTWHSANVTRPDLVHEPPSCVGPCCGKDSKGIKTKQ